MSNELPESHWGGQGVANDSIVQIKNIIKSTNLQRPVK